jgi:hypothetical protein
LPARADRDPPTDGQVDRILQYTYIVHYAGGQTLPGLGDFISVTGSGWFAPSILEHVIGAEWHNHNPCLIVSEVMADDAAN